MSTLVFRGDYRHTGIEANIRISRYESITHEAGVLLCVCHDQRCYLRYSMSTKSNFSWGFIFINTYPRLEPLSVSVDQ